jgi:hypothetical protein
VSTSHPYYPIWLKFLNKGLTDNDVEHLGDWSKLAQGIS